MTDDRTCYAPDCDGVAVIRGLCPTCYGRDKTRRRRAVGLQGYRIPRPTATERWWMKWERDPDTAWWVWSGAIDQSGYGRFGQGGRSKNMPAHRWGYQTLVGPIPAGLQLDHLCRNRACVNPSHLEPVTVAENVRRGKNGVLHERPTHCVHGHEYTVENTYIIPTTGSVRCKMCVKIREAKRDADPVRREARLRKRRERERRQRRMASKP